MKRIVCEMCGSNDLVKEDGLFVCQHCGCKYTVEEAKKLMVEGVVKVDTSEKLQNLYMLARRAKETSDSANAEKYYADILKEDPNNWEPVFYHTYFSAMNCAILQISIAATAISNCLGNVFDLTKKSGYDDTEKRVIYNQVTTDTLYISTLLFRSAIDFYNNHRDADHAFGDVTTRCKSSLKTCIVLGETLLQIGECELAIKALDQALSLTSIKINLLHGFDFDLSKEYKELIENKIRECYWKNNESQYTSLVNKKAELQTQLKEIEKNPIIIKYNEIKGNIERETNIKKGLGLFKSKEKKALQQTIDRLESDLSQLQTERDNLIHPIERKIIEIDSTLNRSVDLILREIKHH